MNTKSLLKGKFITKGFFLVVIVGIALSYGSIAPEKNSLNNIQMILANQGSTN